MVVEKVLHIGEFDAGNLRNRASLLAQLQQQGFTQAQNLAQQAFQNQGNLAAQQMGLSNFLERITRSRCFCTWSTLVHLDKVLHNHNYKQIDKLQEQERLNLQQRLSYNSDQG